MFTIAILFAMIAYRGVQAQQSQSATPDGNCCARTNTVHSLNPTEPGLATCSSRRRDGGDITYYTDGLTCDLSANAQTLEDGVTYQIRDVFFDPLTEADYNQVPFNAYYFEQFLKHVGLRVGNLWLSFTQQDTTMKMNYSPSTGQISICGTAYGIIISGMCHATSDGATLCSDGICTDFMDSVLYYVELNIDTALVHNSGAVAEPTNTNGGDWAAYVSEQGLPVNGSVNNKGFFYPIAYPSVMVNFSLIDLSVDNFVVIPDRWKREPLSQMYIVSNNGTGLGFDGFVGVAGIKTHGLPPPVTIYDFSTSTPKLVIMSSIVNGISITVPALYADIPSGIAGNGLFMFLVEAGCSPNTVTCALASQYVDSQSTTAEAAGRKKSNGANLLPLYLTLAGLGLAGLLFVIGLIILHWANERKRYLI